MRKLKKYTLNAKIKQSTAVLQGQLIKDALVIANGYYSVAMAGSREKKSKNTIVFTQRKLFALQGYIPLDG
jgi:hypothetical protein